MERGARGASCDASAVPESVTDAPDGLVRDHNAPLPPECPSPTDGGHYGSMSFGGGGNLRAWQTVLAIPGTTYEFKGEFAGAGTTVIRLHGGRADAPVIISSSASRRLIRYQPDGSSGGSNSSFTFCDRRGLARPRVICLSGTGRPRLSTTRCDGRPVACNRP